MLSAVHNRITITAAIGGRLSRQSKRTTDKPNKLVNVRSVQFAPLPKNSTTAAKQTEHTRKLASNEAKQAKMLLRGLRDVNCVTIRVMQTVHSVICIKSIDDDECLSEK